MADGELYTTFVDASPLLPLPTQPIDEIAVVRSGVTYKARPSDLTGGLIGGIGFTVYVTPVSGDTITAVFGQGAFGVIPAGPIAVLHLVLPPFAIEGQVFEISTTEDIGAAGLDAVGAVGDSMAVTSGGPNTLAANGGASWRYRLFNHTWYPRD
jgi:hypothetical protein